MTTDQPKPRHLAAYAGGVFAGALSAGMLALALTHTGTPFILFAYLAVVPLFAAGLGAGIICGVLACLVGTACLFASMPATYGFFYLISDAVPAAGLILLAMSARLMPDGELIWSSEGKMLTALVVYPCLIFLCVYLLAMDQAGGLLAMTGDTLNGLSDQIVKIFEDNGQKVTPDMVVQLHQYLTQGARILPTLCMCGWLFSTLISIALAQVVLQQRKWNARPLFALENLHVPTWTIFAAAVTGVVASFAPAPYDYIALNLAFVSGIPFFFAGLAVIHAWAAQTRAQLAVLIVFYVCLLLIVYLVLLVALLGVVDQWIDFRKRFAERKKPDQGERK